MKDMTSLPYSRVTDDNRLSVPAEVREKLGLAPGSVVEWVVDGEHAVVRRAKTYTSEDIRRAVFPKRPRRRSLKDVDEGVAEGIREKYGRR